MNGRGSDCELPRRPRFPATLVLWASDVLTPGEKIVWYHTWTLDRGPERCWISPDKMAVRVGMKRRTIEDYRTRLKRLGLLESFPRPGARWLGWVAVLPAQCLPHSDKVAGDEAKRLAGALDAHIRERERWLTRSASDPDPEDDRAQDPMRTGGKTRSVSGSEPEPDRAVRRRVGGKGGAPSSQGISDSLPPPAQPRMEKREDAIAPQGRMEKREQVSRDDLSEEERAILARWREKRASA